MPQFGFTDIDLDAGFTAMVLDILFEEANHLFGDKTGFNIYDELFGEDLLDAFQQDNACYLELKLILLSQRVLK